MATGKTPPGAGFVGAGGGTGSGGTVGAIGGGPASPDEEEDEGPEWLYALLKVGSLPVFSALLRGHLNRYKPPVARENLAAYHQT